jgi:3-phenylpropionate/cinnamic acid dioxygenase small subunit
VRDLIAGYCQFLDDGLFDDFEQLWTADAVVHVRGDVYEGRTRIREWMEQVQPPQARGRHLVSNTRFTMVGEHEAACISDFVFFARNPQGGLFPKGGWNASASGRYVDRSTDAEGTWRLAERRIEM